MLKVLGYKPSATEVKELIDEWDSNGDGKVIIPLPNQPQFLMPCFINSFNSMSFCIL